MRVSARGFAVEHIDAADVVWVPISGGSWTWTQAPDDSWIDSYSGRGEELEALEQVIEEQRERISRIRPSEDVAP